MPPPMGRKAHGHAHLAEAGEATAADALAERRAEPAEHPAHVEDDERREDQALVLAAHHDRAARRSIETLSRGRPRLGAVLAARRRIVALGEARIGGRPRGARVGGQRGHEVHAREHRRHARVTVLDEALGTRGGAHAAAVLVRPVLRRPAAAALGQAHAALGARRLALVCGLAFVCDLGVLGARVRCAEQRGHEHEQRAEGVRTRHRRTSIPEPIDAARRTYSS
jgi:hypothetical protein